MVQVYINVAAFRWPLFFATSDEEERERGEKGEGRRERGEYIDGVSECRSVGAMNVERGASKREEGLFMVACG